MNDNPEPLDPAADIRFRPLKREAPLKLALDRLVPADDPVRLIQRWVDGLDFAALYLLVRARRGQPGAPVHDPRTLFALWLYASIEGVGSARQLAELCGRDLPFLWLSGQTRPNYHTLADFYSTHETFLRTAFTDHIATLREHGLITLKEVTLDGRKIPAHASKESFHREPTLTRHRREAEEQMANLAAQRAAGRDEGRQREAARARAAEEKRQRLADALEVVKARQAERAARERADGAAPADARASETDPDARTMKLAHGGYRPAYNTQTVTDTALSLIVTVDVTAEGSDNGLVGPMLDRVEEETGRRPERALVDAGYSHQEDLERCEAAGTAVYMPPRNERSESKAGKDPYAKKRDDTPAVAAWRARMGTAEARAIYRRRAPVAEGVHAQQKNRGWRSYRLRGLVKVNVEALWQALAHNISVLFARNRLPGGALRAAAG